jgi:hypothetical protein
MVVLAYLADGLEDVVLDYFGSHGTVDVPLDLHVVTAGVDQRQAF